MKKYFCVEFITGEIMMCSRACDLRRHIATYQRITKKWNLYEQVKIKRFFKTYERGTK